MALFHQRVDAMAFHAGSMAATAAPRERRKGTATKGHVLVAAGHIMGDAQILRVSWLGGGGAVA